MRYWLLVGPQKRHIFPGNHMQLPNTAHQILAISSLMFLPWTSSLGFHDFQKMKISNVKIYRLDSIFSLILFLLFCYTTQLVGP